MTMQPNSVPASRQTTPASPADWREPAARCPLVTIEDLQLRGAGRLLLDGLTMSMGPGEFWAIVGPNGVGKSTLMSVLAGLRKPEHGDVCLDGQFARQISPPALARMRAYLPQAVHDTFSMSVRDAVRVGRHPFLAGWGWASRDDDALVDAVMREMDLPALAQRDVLTLSGGERQRVSLAATLAQQAPLLLLDEPLAHLDLRHQIMVLDALAGLARAGRHAVVVILHDLNLARRYATHALLMAEAGPARHGAASDVLTAANCSAALRTVIVDVIGTNGHAALIPVGGGGPSPDTTQ